MKRTAITCTIIATLGLLASAALLTAGPLTPPAGPVAPTYKTLAEVEARIAINATNTPGDSDSSINGAAGAGIDLDLVSNNAVVADAHVFGCGSLGIRVGDRGVVRACEVASCGGTGIATGFGSAVRDCVVSACSNGISASTGVTISNCSAYSNSARGISTSSGCTVTDCIARDNALDGILVSSNCTVRGNMCSSSNGVGGGAGIRATGTDNRIEGNNCTGADRGIDVDVAGNIIIKNTCSRNTTNGDVVADYIILVVSNTSAGAVLGNTGGVAPASTDPNANFTYRCPHATVGHAKLPVNTASSSLNADSCPLHCADWSLGGAQSCLSAKNSVSRTAQASYRARCRAAASNSPRDALSRRTHP